MIQACKSCGARVLWAVTPAGKSMPIDAEPTTDGNLVLEHPDPRQAPTARVLRSGERVHLRYTSHFATCRDAPKWRKSRMAVVR